MFLNLNSNTNLLNVVNPKFISFHTHIKNTKWVINVSYKENLSLLLKASHLLKFYTLCSVSDTS